VQALQVRSVKVAQLAEELIGMLAEQRRATHADG
jgi:hypothetical protein